MRFYMDEYVPRAVTLGLRLLGVDVLTVQEDGLAGFPDSVILDRASTIGYVVYTQDHEFLSEPSRRLEFGEPFAGVVYGHPLRLPVGQRVKDLHLIATQAAPDELANRIECLPL